MREVAVIGIGMHKWGKFPENTFLDLAAYAAREALKDAGVGWMDVEMVSSGIYKHGGDAGLLSGNMLMSRLGEIGVPVVNIWGACATATSVVRTAHQSVASGECDLVMAVAGDMSPLGMLPTISKDPMDPIFMRFQMIGLSNPAYWAMECRQRMEKYGTTELHLAKAKTVCSKYGALNPNARYRKEFTIEEVLNSTMVVDPLRLFEICATSDGAAAVVMCSMDKARKYTTKPLTIAGVGLGSRQYGDPTDSPGMVALPPTATDVPLLSESYNAARNAYRYAGIGPEDIDFLELPDNSSWHYLQYPETLGFWGPGESEHMLDEGETMKGGKLPICPSGGFAAFGEATAAQALAQLCEVVWQLRGDSGERQVEGAKVGMAQSYGLFGSSGSIVVKK
ncbi:hypothetical protein ACFLW6_02225 [Chloroflexota bacterium]